jgi:uncharacterized membrane protein YcgQ (UPF0703/DUF1980 family)
MSHSHDHSHDHSHGCCGHDHSHEKAVPEHSHKGCCGHEHSPEHTHAGSCCGHDHSHDGEEGDSDAAWTHRMFMFIEMFVLLMTGGVLCYFVASGRIEGRGGAPYVTGWFKGLALAGGLGIMIMGLFNFLQRRRNAGCNHDHHEGGETCCSHDHSHDAATGGHAAHSHDGGMGSRALVLLLLSGSIAAGAMLTPDTYSGEYLMAKGAAYDAAGAGKISPRGAAVLAELKEQNTGGGTLTLANVEKYRKRNAAGNFDMGVIELYYLGQDEEYARVMEKQGVESTGQLVKDEVNPGDGHARLIVLETTCCAADSRPYSIPVRFEGALPEFVPMGWYKVSGSIALTEERGIRVALIKATDLTATVRPAAQRTIF